MDPLWIEAFRYHRWANLHLLDVCAGLSPDQLDLTAPGTYGTVAGTWLHLLAAEQRYLRRFGGSEPQLKEKDGFPGIAVLKEQAARTGDELIESAARITPDDVVESKYDNQPVRLHLGVVMIQALHHGNDHRTHICTILGHHQIPYGDMDVWAYGDTIGAIVPITSKS
ncbi:MAG TPA: DinB family protein [Candidatus Nitrosotalea sp.]|nr:DinB family protein [Candidatus Nitrosotalea sp.]